MAFTIITKNSEKTYTDKQLINISSKPGYDILVNTDFPFMLTLQYDARTNRCLLINQFNNKKFLFKGKPIPASLEIDNISKIMVDGSDEFITIKVSGPSQVMQQPANETMTADDIKLIYGNDAYAATRLKLENKKAEIEDSRVAIVKQITAPINNLKNRLSMNSKSGIVLHIALFLASFVCAFGVSNYLTGLPLSDAGSVIQMPTNLKLIFIYALVIYGVGLVMKHGVYMFLQSNENKKGVDNTTAQKFMIIMPLAFYIGVYLINVLY